MSKDTVQTSNHQAQEVAEQHGIIGNRSATPVVEFRRTTHPDAQWYPEAGLGLFLHWGISSVRGQGDLSWSMIAREAGHARNSVERYGLPAVQVMQTPANYWAQTKDFKPDRYDANKWLAGAKKVGMRYAVFTTKHHDGFSLWPSDQGHFSTKNYLKGRDLVGEYVAACRANDLKVGFYYSPPDWYEHHRYHNMSFRYDAKKPAWGLHHEQVELPVQSPEEKAKLRAGFQAYVKAQVEELLTRYGKIDLLWFDGFADEAISMERIRELQPGIVVNPRGHGYGDFETSECAFPKKRWPAWWEYCHILNDGAWGYLDHEIYKPLGWFLAEFVRARSWGGNFLPSVGPDSHGELPEVFYKRLKQLEGWLQHSGKSVFGTEPGPWPEKSNVPLTIRGTTWYAHADWLHDVPIEIEARQPPQSVKLLRTGDSLPWKMETGRLVIEIPNNWRTNLVDVVDIEW
jgi:alpha-L-fucosidase